jgi:hypothetical protein
MNLATSEVLTGIVALISLIFFLVAILASGRRVSKVLVTYAPATSTRSQNFHYSNLISAACIGLILLLPGSNFAAELPQLVVSPDGRSFTQDGKPFFWMGDDAWGLFNKLSLNSTVPDSSAANEFEHFFQVRREQGFSVIHTWLGAGWMKTNRERSAPFQSPLNTASPVLINQDYFENVADVVQLADQHGLYITMEVGIVFRSDVPEWWLGGFDANDDGEGDGAKDHEAHIRKSYEYGWKIANALKRNGQPLDNLIWGLGQDIHPLRERRVGKFNADNDAEWLVDLVRALAEGIADGTNDVPLSGPDGKADYSTTLMSFHPGATQVSSLSAGQPGSSATWFHDDEWLDFNTRQTGRRFLFNDAYYFGLVDDYRRAPTKPVLEMEGGFESGPAAGEPGRVFRDYHVRLQAYWTYLSGSFGFGYGHGSVYPFSEGETTRGTDEPMHWTTALLATGAGQLKYLRNLLEDRVVGNLLPDHAAAQKLLVTEPGSNFSRIVAARARDGSFGIIYATNGRSFDVDLTQLSGNKVNARWFNPRTGEVTTAGVHSNSNSVHFDPPGQSNSGDSPKGNDWVLVLDDSERLKPITTPDLPGIDVFAPDVLQLPEAGTQYIHVALGAQPSSSVEVTVSQQDGDSDLTIVGSTELNFDEENWDTAQSVLLRADNDVDSVDGTATVTLSSPGFRSADITVVEIDDDLLSINAVPVDVESGASSSEQPVATPVINIPPIAQADSLTVLEGTVDNELAVLTDNGDGADSDGDGDLLRISAVVGEGAASGVMAVNAAADRLLYTPPRDFSGIDRFRYTITDDRGGFSTASVVIETLNVDNDPPGLGAMCNYIVTEGSELRFSMMAPDPDGGQGTLDVDLSAFPAQAQFNAETREFSWTPTRDDASQSPYLMSVSVTDRLDSSMTETQMIQVLVNKQTEGVTIRQQGCVIAFEAEDFSSNDERSGHQWERHVALPKVPAGYSGTAAMRVLPEDYSTWKDGFARRAPEVEYEIDFASSGTYSLWVRAYSSDGNSNSFHTGLNGKTNAGLTNIEIDPGLSWKWVKAGDIDVPTTGGHALNIWARETGLVIDKIVLSRYPDFTPKGAGPVSQ